MKIKSNKKSIKITCPNCENVIAISKMELSTDFSFKKKAGLFPLSNPNNFDFYEESKIMKCQECGTGYGWPLCWIHTDEGWICG